jgi:phosphoglycolate phosphatase-like HAD superfamily hydrolase
MAAARAANAYAVGVTTVSNDEHDLETAGANLALPDLDAFATWLPRHLLPQQEPAEHA